MELKEFLELINKKKQTILSVVLVFLIITVIFTIIQPLEYSTESRLMVVQNFKEGTDPYAAAKSNEYLSSILSKVVISSEFFDEVIVSGYNVDSSYFSSDPKKTMKKWEKMIEAKPVNDTGIIMINIFHKDRYQAEQIANSINYILKTKHTNYHGGGDAVKIKIIDKPITSKWPVKPNIPMNVGFGIFFGLIIALIYINIFPEEEYDVKFFPKKKKKRVEANWESVGGLAVERYSDILKNEDVDKQASEK